MHNQVHACGAKLKVLIGLLYDCWMDPLLGDIFTGSKVPLQLCIVIATLMYWVR